jgi:hypothetical protein
MDSTTSGVDTSHLTVVKLSSYGLPWTLGTGVGTVVAALVVVLGYGRMFISCTRANSEATPQCALVTRRLVGEVREDLSPYASSVRMAQVELTDEEQPGPTLGVTAERGTRWLRLGKRNEEVVSAFERFLESPKQERLELFLSDDGGWLFLLPLSGLLGLGLISFLQTTGRITLDMRTGAVRLNSRSFRHPTIDVRFNLNEVDSFETEAVEDTEFRALVMMKKAGERCWLLSGGDSDTYEARDALQRALTVYRARREASSALVSDES